MENTVFDIIILAGQSNDETFHNGDNIHFCAKSVYELGKRYFDAYAKLRKN